MVTPFRYTDDTVGDFVKDHGREIVDVVEILRDRLVFWSKFEYFHR